MRTNQRLAARIKQHVPTKIQLGNYFADHIDSNYRAAIAEHLINNRDCASSYSVDLFNILSRSNSHFHLKVLETITILTHKRKQVSRSFLFFKMNKFGLFVQYIYICVCVGREREREREREIN